MRVLPPIDSETAFQHTLDVVRGEAWCEAHVKVAQAENAKPRGRGRQKADDPEAQNIADAKAKAEQIKKSAFTQGNAPEHLTENQELKPTMIAENDKRLYQDYSMKELLRLILKLKDKTEADAKLKR